MALRSAIRKHLYKHQLPSISNIIHSPLAVVIPNFHHLLFTSLETSSSTGDTGVYHRRQINRSPRLKPPELFNLREKLNISNGDWSPVTENAPSGSNSGGFSIRDARKVIRCLQLENVRSNLKMIPTNSITYSEFISVCVDACNDRDLGVEFAKVLDVAGDVLVLGNIVFIRPHQVAKSMEKIISQSIAIPNDPRKQELEELERQIAVINLQAISQVRCELYFGLGLLILQTLGFMRLTFWELSWDVMEPICFFVTSLHFAFAYMFFLKTSKEPGFEGYFQQRFRTKQKKLMSVHKFNFERYNELCNVFYPNYQDRLPFFCI